MIHTADIRTWIFTLFFIFRLFVPDCLAGGTLELESALDGGGRLGHSMLCRDGSWGWSLYFRTDPGAETLFRAAINSPFGAFGTLGSAGAVSEMRNPSFTALSRLNERTLVRADLRSRSGSRSALALFSPNERVGLILQDGRDDDSLQFWLIPYIRSRPPYSETVFELAGAVGSRRSSDSVESWYPESRPPVSGLLLTPFSRIRLEYGHLTVGLTVQGSAGLQMNPGILVALALNYSGGPWRIRSRYSWNSVGFRTADYSSPPAGSGFAADLRYRPSKGLQLNADVQTAFESNEGEESGCPGEASLALGWKWPRWRILLSGEWNREVSEHLWLSGSPAVLALELGWNPGFAAVDLCCRIEEGGGERYRAEVSFPSFGAWSFKQGTTLQRHQSVLLWDADMELRWKKPGHSVQLRLNLADLPRDWCPGPEGTGDLNVTIRYRKTLGD